MDRSFDGDWIGKPAGSLEYRKDCRASRSYRKLEFVSRVPVTNPLFQPLIKPLERVLLQVIKKFVISGIKPAENRIISSGFGIIVLQNSGGFFHLWQSIRTIFIIALN